MRHLLSQHRENSEVSSILKLNKSKRRRHFAVLRNRGILEKSKSNPKNIKPIKESNNSDCKDVNIVCCSNCKGSYYHTYFYRHKNLCNKEIAKPIADAALGNEKNDEDMKNKMRDLRN
jgi:predicted transcriptional regulator